MKVNEVIERLDLTEKECRLVGWSTGDIIVIPVADVIDLDLNYKVERVSRNTYTVDIIISIDDMEDIMRRIHAE